MSEVPAVVRHPRGDHRRCAERFVVGARSGGVALVRPSSWRSSWSWRPVAPLLEFGARRAYGKHRSPLGFGNACSCGRSATSSTGRPAVLAPLWDEKRQTWTDEIVRIVGVRVDDQPSVLH